MPAREEDHNRDLLTEEDLREMVLRLTHEIRNPLATIKSGVQLVRRLTAPHGEVASHFEAVLLQVDRIDLTLGDMQRFVRLGAGRVTPVVVAESVEEIVRELRREAAATGTSVAVTGDRGVTVSIDEENLRLCLRELIGNAIRFSPPASAVSVWWERRGPRRVAVSIDDDGPGIPEERAGRIMRPFFSTSTQGTGLGLNIADKICRLSGGRLEWANLPGRGCRFSLLLAEA